jgi:DNA-binding response OmpR family regulator
MTAPSSLLALDADLRAAYRPRRETSRETHHEVNQASLWGMSSLGRAMYTIMIIEGDLRNQELLRYWLEDAGYRVNAFADTASAQSVLQRCGPVDLIIVAAPNDNRLSTIRDQLQSRAPVLTLRSDFSEKQSANNFNVYVMKPVDLYELLRNVAECLQ